jgi:hypothetical protein
MSVRKALLQFGLVLTAALVSLLGFWLINLLMGVQWRFGPRSANVRTPPTFEERLYNRLNSPPK